MSWWDTGNGDDVIGDQPADLARHGLKRIVEAKAQQSQEKPRLADLLRAIGAVATTAGEQLLDKTPANLREIVAELKSGQTISSGLLEERREAGDLESTLKENLRTIAGVYQERWERNPRLTEWLDVLSFVLRTRPEDFLHDGAEHPPAQLKAIGGG